MNILLVNNAHFIRGGADTFYFKTAELLEKKGHRCIFFSMKHPKNLPCETEKYFMPYVDLNAKYGIIDQIKIASRIIYSFEARKRISQLLDRYPVDIAHFHNIYHNISPSILHELKKRKIPVVMTIHDPKLVCGSHNMYIYVNSEYGKVCKICEECANGRYYMAVIKRCVKDSFAKSLVVMLEMFLHHRVLDIYKNVDVFISPSLFFKKKFKEMGFDKEIIHLPYFIDTEKVKELKEFESNPNKEKSVVFFGRLSLEKGLFTLIKAAKRLSIEKSELKIKIIGDGPIRNRLQEIVKKENIGNIKFFGYMEHGSLYKEIRKSIAAILPSEWYDNYPMSIIETFAVGIPVIGSRIGGIPEMVKDYKTGLTFTPWDPDDLYKKLRYVAEHPEEAVKWGEHGRRFVETELNAEKHYKHLMEIYQYALEKVKKINS